MAKIEVKRRNTLLFTTNTDVPNRKQFKTITKKRRWWVALGEINM